uniref:Uncharacterized protein n=1 Tax=Siphoviridae sp. ct96x5 TaxID=2825367 RepID=A0A8S5PT72_9CAUD|nr:MAG TPA: hypothetical protein [Siphoviridae sp. ct96x5]
MTRTPSVSAYNIRFHDLSMKTDMLPVLPKVSIC